MVIVSVGPLLKFTSVDFIISKKTRLLLLTILLHMEHFGFFPAKMKSLQISQNGKCPQSNMKNASGDFKQSWQEYFWQVWFLIWSSSFFTFSNNRGAWFLSSSSRRFTFSSNNFATSNSVDAKTQLIWVHFLWDNRHNYEVVFKYS